jgi:glucosamine--fructose-6-phosphate aminotransferase (isomerizing)
VGHSVDVDDGLTGRKDESEPGEIFLASDPAAIFKYTQRMAFLEDDEIVHVQNGHLSLYKHVADNQAIPDRKILTITGLDEKMPSKGDFPHYMRKEIFEQPRVIADVLSKRLHSKSGCHVTLGAMDPHLERLRGCSRLIFVACGSSYYASLAVRNVFEELNNVVVSIEVASEFLDRPTWTSLDSTAFIFVTQSGETAECLQALRRCKDMGCFTVGVVNVANSSIARQADCVMYLEAGVEIAVATTKAYTSQLVNLVLLAIALGQHRTSTLARREEVIAALRLLPDQMQTALALDDAVKELCMTKLANVRTMLVLGRGYQHATALEAALKIKEVSYVHSEAVLSGELKHGVLALIDEEVPVIMIATRDASFARTLNSHEQRKCPITSLASSSSSSTSTSF